MINVILTDKDFETLVKGRIVAKAAEREGDGGESEPVQVMLQDIGFHEMARLISEAMEEYRERLMGKVVFTKGSSDD